MQNTFRRQASRKIPRWLTVSALGGFTLMGAVLIWSFETDSQMGGNRTSSAAITSSLEDADDCVAYQFGNENNDNRILDEPELHSVIYDLEKGVRIVRIQLVEGGDEIVVNAETGQFIEKRLPAASKGKNPASIPMTTPIMPPMVPKSSMG